MRCALIVSLAACVLGCALLTGCAAPCRSAGGIPGVTAYYEQATRPERRDVRKPIRDARHRALRELAEHAEALAVEPSTAAGHTAAGAPSTQVVPAPAQRGAPAAAAIEYAAALRGLADAARDDDLIAVRHAYRRALAARAALGEGAAAGS